MAEEPINIVNRIPGQQPPTVNVHVELDADAIGEVIGNAVAKAMAKWATKIIESMPAPVVNVEHPKRSFTIEHDDGTKTQVMED